MDSSRLVGIGPLAPPITGPGIKNQCLKSGFEDLGYDIEWIDTLENRKKSIYDLLTTGKQNYYIISVSKKGRFILSPIIWSKVNLDGSRAVLLPAGGNFANELARLNFPFYEVFSKLFSSFDAILPEANEEMNQLTEHFDSNTEIDSLPNLRKRPDYPPNFKVSESVIDCIYVGRIKRSKGLDDLITAIKRLNQNNQNVSADVYGHFLENDPYKRNFLNSCSVTDGVEFKGKIPSGEVIDTVANYDILIFPTHYKGEGFPGIVIESFMAGTPVLATDWNYNSELIIENYNGKLVEPMNPVELAEKIRWFKDNPDELLRMQKNAWECSNRYSVESVVSKLLDILREQGWDL